MIFRIWNEADASNRKLVVLDLIIELLHMQQN